MQKGGASVVVCDGAQRVPHSCYEEVVHFYVCIYPCIYVQNGNMEELSSQIVSSYVCTRFFFQHTGLFCQKTSLFCQNIDLFCQHTGLFWQHKSSLLTCFEICWRHRLCTRLFCQHIGLFCQSKGLLFQHLFTYSECCWRHCL